VKYKEIHEERDNYKNLYLKLKTQHLGIKDKLSKDQKQMDTLQETKSCLDSKASVLKNHVTCLKTSLKTKETEITKLRNYTKNLEEFKNKLMETGGASPEKKLVYTLKEDCERKQRRISELEGTCEDIKSKFEEQHKEMVASKSASNIFNIKQNEKDRKIKQLELEIIVLKKESKEKVNREQLNGLREDKGANNVNGLIGTKEEILKQEIEKHKASNTEQKSIILAHNIDKYDDLKRKYSELLDQLEDYKLDTCLKDKGMGYYGNNSPENKMEEKLPMVTKLPAFASSEGLHHNEKEVARGISDFGLDVFDTKPKEKNPKKVFTFGNYLGQVKLDAETNMNKDNTLGQKTQNNSNYDIMFKPPINKTTTMVEKEGSNAHTAEANNNNESDAADEANYNFDCLDLLP
jgi:hypothetical protein